MPAIPMTHSHPRHERAEWIDSPYRSGRLARWLKMKNPAGPGVGNFAILRRRRRSQSSPLGGERGRGLFHKTFVCSFARRDRVFWIDTDIWPAACVDTSAGKTADQKSRLMRVVAPMGIIFQTPEEGIGFPITGTAAAITAYTQNFSSGAHVAEARQRLAAR